jgi:LytS/YehU family sensor histidine kinase
MILQPLLENAVTHGVASVPGDGWVRLVAAPDGDRLRLVVADSGRGFRTPAGDGIGLANTRERLRTLYGAAQNLVLGDAAGGGARVEVTLPLRREPR